MDYKFAFKTEEEKRKIIEDNIKLTIVEEQYLFEGNFLILSDNPRIIEPIYIDVTKEEIEELKIQNLILSETIELILTEIIPSIKGGV